MNQKILTANTFLNFDILRFFRYIDSANENKEKKESQEKHFLKKLPALLREVKLK